MNRVLESRNLRQGRRISIIGGKMKMQPRSFQVFLELDSAFDTLDREAGALESETTTGTTSSG